MKPAALLLALAAGAAQAEGYACLDLSDAEQRRWFQTEPCGPGYVHSPLPNVPLIREAPRLPDDLGPSPGSSWQVLGFDHRGRPVGVWVPRGTAVPFISTDVVRVNRGTRGGGRRWRRRGCDLWRIARINGPRPSRINFRSCDRT